MRPARVWILLPGLLHAFALTALAFLLAVYARPHGIDAVAIGVVLGLVAGNVVPMGPLFGPGVAFVAKRVLQAAVVLLGLRVTLRELGGIGPQAAVAVVLVVVGSLVLAALLGRWFRVRSPMALLLGAGTAICGVAAIAAARAAVRGKEEDVTYSVAAITLLGTLGLLVYPAVQLAFHPFDAATYGILAGATLQSVPQAVGAAFAGGGAEAGGIGALVKLSRVALLGPVVLLLAVLVRHEEGGKGVLRLPVEVWGFLVLVLVGSVVALPSAVRQVVIDVDTVLLVWALTALGLQTRFRDLRAAGSRPLLVAAGVWLGVVGAVVASTWLWAR